jgi:hypothetical protein
MGSFFRSHIASQNAISVLFDFVRSARSDTKWVQTMFSKQAVGATLTREQRLVGSSMNNPAGHKFVKQCQFSSCAHLLPCLHFGTTEPGSGTSIMGYAGVCSPNNVQANSDP